MSIVVTGSEPNTIPNPNPNLEPPPSARCAPWHRVLLTPRIRCIGRGSTSSGHCVCCIPIAVASVAPRSCIRPSRYALLRGKSQGIVRQLQHRCLLLHRRRHRCRSRPGQLTSTSFILRSCCHPDQHHRVSRWGVSAWTCMRRCLDRPPLNIRTAAIAGLVSRRIP